MGITGLSLGSLRADKVVPLPFEDSGLHFASALAWSDAGPRTRALTHFIDAATTCWDKRQHASG